MTRRALTLLAVIAGAVVLSAAGDVWPVVDAASDAGFTVVVLWLMVRYVKTGRNPFGDDRFAPRHARRSLSHGRSRNRDVGLEIAICDGAVMADRWARIYVCDCLRRQGFPKASTLLSEDWQ